MWWVSLQWLLLFGANFRGDFVGMPETEQHPWMGSDRYHIAKNMLEEAPDNFDVEDCFRILKAVSQEVCPTVVSMVFYVTQMEVYWCENRQWDQIQKKRGK